MKETESFQIIEHSDDVVFEGTLKEFQECFESRIYTEEAVRDFCKSMGWEFKKIYLL